MLKNDKETFFDPSQPLTSTIFKSLNFEFMCCILSGLKQISERDDKRLRKTDYINEDGVKKKRTRIKIQTEPSRDKATNFQEYIIYIK